MIKKYFLFAIVFIALGCSNKDNEIEKNEEIDNNTSTTSILPVKLLSEDGQSSTIKYDGNKFVSFTSDTNPGDKTLFTYDGDYIINIKEYEDNILDEETDYTYSNGKLINTHLIDYSSDDQTNMSYTYVNDNLIRAIKTKSRSNYQYTVNLEYKLNSDGVVASFSGLGNEINNGKSVDCEESGTVTYDDKNALFKNVLGLNKLILADDELISNNKNNILVYKRIKKPKQSNSTNAVGTSWKYYKVNYAYSKDNYPSKEIRRFYNLDETPSSEMNIVLYEYNK